MVSTTLCAGSVVEAYWFGFRIMSGVLDHFFACTSARTDTNFGLETDNAKMSREIEKLAITCRTKPYQWLKLPKHFSTPKLDWNTMVPICHGGMKINNT